MWESLIIIAISATPVIELRGSIPVAIGVFGMPIWQAVSLALIGNLIPVCCVYIGLDIWTAFVEKRKGILHRLTDRVITRAHGVFTHKRAAYGVWALALFVAIPLPMTGALTGSVAAYIFGIPFKKAFPAITVGLIIAAIIVTLTVTGVSSGLNAITPTL